MRAAEPAVSPKLYSVMSAQLYLLMLWVGGWVAGDGWRGLDALKLNVT